ncbi:hypothetical protein GGD38_006846 [Chitinophagaceae bacterium OAS944]|nr:hypothetical protein [Chitinophagaceae bacterium OAS944]
MFGFRPDQQSLDNAKSDVFVGRFYLMKGCE